MPAKQPSDKGAVHTAARLETHEAEAERIFSELTSKLPGLWEEYNAADGDGDRQKSLVQQIESVQKQSDVQFKRWMDLSGKVRDFYKSVAEEKRDGEKISRIDVERLLTNAWRFQRIGRESFIISIAQDAIHCRDEQDFHAKYAEAIRECEVNALRNGIEHDKFPEFVKTCYEESL